MDGTAIAATGTRGTEDEMRVPKSAIVDGNHAAASIAYRLSEVIAIYPITPASPMGELSDAWSVEGRRNIWNTVPQVSQLQSEAGAAAAVHGALQTGALSTTFTASQGLLLMIPNLYKIAGELTSCCLHVAARSVATHALSIFGDHSDVMAVRQTGFALLASGSVQEAHDLAAVAHMATLASRIPFIHFFDGFRTSHELSKIETISDEQLREMIDRRLVVEHRRRALSPEHPVIRGTAQNPDAFFQAREAAEPYFRDCPGHVAEAMEKLAAVTGRRYRLFDYYGSPEAKRILVIMGSGAKVAREAVERLVASGEKVGVIEVRLYRPFSLEAFAAALPGCVESIAVLDRSKEPGGVGEPLYLDVVTAVDQLVAGGALQNRLRPRVIGGRFGLSSKELTPSMVYAVLDELRKEAPKNHFTIGIRDDVCHSSLDFDPDLDIEGEDVTRALFFGLGSDGTVGANKNSIKIIGEKTDHFAQGYFVYDSKKAGAVTVSHLRFGPKPIQSSYLIQRADFVACHHASFLENYDPLELARPGATVLLNMHASQEEVWDRLPREVQQTIIDKKLRVFSIDAHAVAREAGLGRRINTIMQTCFFAIAGILDADQAIDAIKEAIEATYGRRNPKIVENNIAAVDAALDHLYEIERPTEVSTTRSRPPIVSSDAPDFVQKVTSVLMAGKGDSLPVSAFPPDGTWPTGTAKWEKRGIAYEIPIWDPQVCIQCNQCALVCPHAAIRAKVYGDDVLGGSPPGFRSTRSKQRGGSGVHYTLQVAPDDCTGCHLCVMICPAKNKSNPRLKAINMHPRREHREREAESYSFFLSIPETRVEELPKIDVRSTQVLEPLFEYSGACAGCGETPYIKLLTQLFGDRLLIANATGCSSIYGGNLPTTPYSVNAEGRGPAWSNSLFEDNAEFGYGYRLSLDAQRLHLKTLIAEVASALDPKLVSGLEALLRETRPDTATARRLISQVRAALKESSLDSRVVSEADVLLDLLAARSVWLIGGDGWAYDIGYGGLDHVLAQHRNINVLVLDTEVYSNTGGQQSKATPLGAVAKFAAAGKEIPKKDLGMEAMSYGHVYVARIALGGKMSQTVRALCEADAYDGPSLVIAYSHCIAHGYDLRHGMSQQKLAVDSGIWPLYRFDPARTNEGLPPLQLDSKKPKIPTAEFMKNEARFRMVEKLDRKRYLDLQERSQRDAERRYEIYRQLSEIRLPKTEDSEAVKALRMNEGDGGEGA